MLTAELISEPEPKTRMRLQLVARKGDEVVSKFEFDCEYAEQRNLLDILASRDSAVAVDIQMRPDEPVGAA